LGSPKARFDNLADLFDAVGSHKATYDYAFGNSCGPGESKLPSPDLQPTAENNEPVFSGQTVSGNICFQVASNDAASLLFYVKPPSATPNAKPIWFALR